MIKPLWDDDERLLADLQAAVGDVEPLASRVAERAMELFSWRTVDEDLLLASLTFDSAVPAPRDAAASGPGAVEPGTGDDAWADELVGAMRSQPADARVLVFDTPRLSVELEVASDQIVGQLIPPGPAEVVVEDEYGVRSRLQADDRGFFVVSPLPTGRVRLRCDTPTGRVLTDWVML